jgi:hypothetical protein
VLATVKPLCHRAVMTAKRAPGRAFCFIYMAGVGYNWVLKILALELIQ